MTLAALTPAAGLAGGGQGAGGVGGMTRSGPIRQPPESSPGREAAPAPDPARQEPRVRPASCSLRPGASGGPGARPARAAGTAASRRSRTAHLARPDPASPRLTARPTPAAPPTRQPADTERAPATGSTAARRQRRLRAGWGLRPGWRAAAARESVRPSGAAMGRCPCRCRCRCPCRTRKAGGLLNGAWVRAGEGSAAPRCPGPPSRPAQGRSVRLSLPYWRPQARWAPAFSRDTGQECSSVGQVLALPYSRTEMEI